MGVITTGRTVNVRICNKTDIRTVKQRTCCATRRETIIQWSTSRVEPSVKVNPSILSQSGTSGPDAAGGDERGAIGGRLPGPVRPRHRRGPGRAPGRDRGLVEDVESRLRARRAVGHGNGHSLSSLQQTPPPLRNRGRGFPQGPPIPAPLAHLIVRVAVPDCRSVPRAAHLEPPALRQLDQLDPIVVQLLAQGAQALLPAVNALARALAAPLPGQVLQNAEPGVLLVRVALRSAALIRPGDRQ